MVQMGVDAYSCDTRRVFIVIFVFLCRVSYLQNFLFYSFLFHPPVLLIANVLF